MGRTTRKVVSVLCATTLAVSLCPGFAALAVADEGATASKSLAPAVSSDALVAQDDSSSIFGSDILSKITDALKATVKAACKAVGVEYDETKTPAENAQAALDAAKVKGAAAEEAVAKAACKAAGVEYDETKTPCENTQAVMTALETMGKAKAAEAAQKAAEAVCQAAGIEYDATKTPVENAQAALKAAQDTATAKFEATKQAVAMAASQAAGVAYDKAKSAVENIQTALQKAAASATENADAIAKAACKAAGIEYDASKSAAANITAALEAAAQSVIDKDAKDVSNATVTAEDATYTGAPLTPSVTVTLKNKRLKKGTDYDLVYADNTQAGTGIVIVMGKNAYAGATYQTFTIKKAANTIKAQAKKKTFTYKASTLAKKSVTIKKSTAFKVTKAKGKVTYSKKTASKAIKSKVTISSTGKITLKKGIKAGTYTLKAKVHAAGDSNYKAKNKYVTFKIKVTKK